MKITNHFNNHVLERKKILIIIIIKENTTNNNKIWFGLEQDLGIQGFTKVVRSKAASGKASKSLYTMVKREV